MLPHSSARYSLVAWAVSWLLLMPLGAVSAADEADSLRVETEVFDGDADMPLAKMLPGTFWQSPQLREARRVSRVTTALAVRSSSMIRLGNEWC